MTQTEPHMTEETTDRTPTVSVVIPALNEVDNLREILPLMPTNAELVLVTPYHQDDGSVEVAKSLRPDIVCIHHHRKGKGNALQVGFEAALGDIIVMFDADGSADPREIDRLVMALRNGAEMAKGSRYMLGGWSDDLNPWRSLGNKFLTTVANRLFGTTYTDLCYGYMAFWWASLDTHATLPPSYGSHTQWGDGFEIEAMLVSQFAKSGAKVVEVPSHELPRIHGHSNLHPIRDGLRILKTLLTEHRRRNA